MKICTVYFNFLYVWKFGWIHDHIWNQTGSNQNLPIWLLKKWQQCVELQTMGSNYIFEFAIYLFSDIQQSLNVKTDVEYWMIFIVVFF